MSEFKDFYIFKILKIIQLHLSVEELITLGLNYSQIALLLNDVKAKKLIFDNGVEGLQLTDVGQIFVDKFAKSNYPLNNKTWIMPVDSERILTKLDTFDIYLPERKKY